MTRGEKEKQFAVLAPKVVVKQCDQISLLCIVHSCLKVD